MSFARRATFAAMITTLTAVCATAKPIATTGETNPRKALGTDSEILTLIPKKTTVEVGNCSNGWCQVSCNEQDGYAIARNLAPALAQEQNAAPSAGGQTPPAPPQTGTPGSRDGPPLFDPTARIKYLHARLRIMPEQEPLWDTVAETIRNNARDIVPLLRERFRATTSGNALDVLQSDEALGEAQLDSLKKFIAVFDALYVSLSENQKKIADAILREGALNTMVGGVPQVPAPFGWPLSDQLSAPYYSPWLWSGLGVPLFVHRPSPFPHFHGLISPGRAAISGRRGFHR
jgi:hypothetical protein